jgi:hypothetical protein
MFCFTDAVIVRQIQEALVVWVTKTMKQQRLERKTGEMREGYRDSKNKKKSKKCVRDEYTKKSFLGEFQQAVRASNL